MFKGPFPAQGLRSSGSVQGFGLRALTASDYHQYPAPRLQKQSTQTCSHQDFDQSNTGSISKAPCFRGPLEVYSFSLYMYVGRERERERRRGSARDREKRERQRGSERERERKERERGPKTSICCAVVTQVDVQAQGPWPSMPVQLYIYVSKAIKE